MYFEGEEALNRLLTRKYRKAEVGLEKCVGMGGKPTISPLVLTKPAIKKPHSVRLFRIWLRLLKPNYVFI